MKSGWMNGGSWVKGYELGNHTFYHPCMRGPGREWVTGI